MSGVRATGGAWDRAARPVYFAAAGVWYPEDDTLRWPSCLLRAVNDVMTAEDERLLLARHLDEGKTVLLDSGIFWLTNRHKRAHGMTMDEALTLPPEDIDGFAELEKRYVELVGRYGDRLWGYIELDQGGAVNKRRTRGRLESLGLAPIPVYHPLLDGWDYFDELAQGYDRMCFGNIVQAPAAVRTRLLHALYERHRAYPGLWVHVLGLTVNEWTTGLALDSCDSSAFISPLRWLKARTETAYCKRSGTLPPSFTYEVGNPMSPGRSWSLSFGLCTDAADATGINWAHLDARIGELAGRQGPHPGYFEAEGPLCPAG